MVYMDIRTIKGRPGAANVVSSLRELLVRTDRRAHTHEWSGIMKHVFTKMSLAYLIRFIIVGEKKLELDVIVHVKTRFARHDDGLTGTVWIKLLVQEAFEEIWAGSASLALGTNTCS